MRGRLLAVLDASVIIAFFQELESHDALLLLQALDYDLSVPQAVHEEIIREPATSLLDQCLAQREIAILPKRDRNEMLQFRLSHPALGAGESEVILNALELRPAGAICLLDEDPARRVASALGLPMTGTVGILNLLRDASLITEAKDRELRQRLRASSFRIDRDLLR